MSYKFYDPKTGVSTRYIVDKDVEEVTAFFVRDQMNDGLIYGGYPTQEEASEKAKSLNAHDAIVIKVLERPRSA